MGGGFPNIPGFSFGSPKQLKPEVEKLRRLIQRGELEQRRLLFEKLGSLAVAHVMECQFDQSLQIIEELTELAETLIEEGQIELRQELFIAISQVITFLPPVSRQNKINCDQAPFFKYYSKCVENLSESDFDEVKNEWALDVHKYAESLHKNNEATVAAIALLDRTIQTMEQRFNPHSSHFTDWNPLLTMYSSRGIWKSEIGDRESALADLLHYDELADKAIKKRQQRRAEVSDRVAKKGDKIIIRIGDGDLIDHLASYHFDDQHYETILQLADMFASRAEKDQAWQYYDKALAIAQKEDRTNAFWALFSASGEVPFRKAYMIMQFHEYENALQLLDLAVQEFTTLLKTDQKHHFSAIERQLIEIARCRANALEYLGRHKEADQALDEMQRLCNKAAETNKISSAANAEKVKSIPYANTLKNSKKENRTSNQNSPPSPKKDAGDDIQQKAMVHLTEKHNEAAMESQRGNLELRRGHYKTALKLFLKARNVLESPLFANFQETQKNLYAIYLGLGMAYRAIKRYDNAEKWYNKAIIHVQKLINDGALDFCSAFCDALESLAFLFSHRQQHKEAFGQFEKVFHERNRLVAENLEGLNIEYLRTHDHQRLAFSALLLQMQRRTIGHIEEQLYALNRIDDAILWGQRCLENFEQFLRLIPDPAQAYYDQCCIMISYATLLLLGKRYEEADAFLEKCEQKFAETQQNDSDSNSAETIKQRKEHIDQLVLLRLFDLLGTKKYRFEKESIIQAHDLFRKKKGHEALPILESLREPIRQHQMEAQNEHRLLQLFWQELAQMIENNIALSYQGESEWSKWMKRYDETTSVGLPDTETNEMVEDGEEEDSEELDQELTQYEQEFGGENVNNNFLYKMLDELTGSTKASTMIRTQVMEPLQAIENGQPFRNDNTVGRNDPCPCGSGKKYKKCCMQSE